MKKIFLLSTLLFASAQLFGQCSVQVTTVNVTCFGSCNGSASAMPAGQAPFTYLWSPGGQTTQTISNQCAGTYTVTVTDANNCTATASATISQPPQMTVNFSSVVNNVCYGECNGSATATVGGGTPAYTYMWNTNPVQFTATATGLCAGTYTFTATDANGCTVYGTVTITQPAFMSATLTSTNASCNTCNGTATVNPSGGTAPYSYQWSPSNQTTQTITGLCAGSYTVTVTDANGCTINNVVTITQPSPITVSSSQTNAICPGDCNATATANPSGGNAPYIYSWSTTPTQINATATGLCAGTYFVTITDANGCTVSASFTITQPTPLIVTTSSTTESCLNCCDATGTITPSGSTPPYFYSWSTSPSQTTATATGLCAGTYTVCVVDINGCIICDTIVIPMFVGVQELLEGSGVHVYPNPFSDKLRFEIPFKGELNIQICDLTGRIIHHETISGKKEMDLSHLEPGAYFLDITSGERLWRVKVIKH